jgi:hypothetical protein
MSFSKEVVSINSEMFVVQFKECRLPGYISKRSKFIYMKNFAKVSSFPRSETER